LRVHFLADFEDFEKSLLRPVRFSKKNDSRKGGPKNSIMTPRTRTQNFYIIDIQIYVCMYVEEFFRVRFRTQFSLNFFETWEDGCFYRELKLYRFWINSAQ